MYHRYRQAVGRRALKPKTRRRIRKTIKTETEILTAVRSIRKSTFPRTRDKITVPDDERKDFVDYVFAKKTNTKDMSVIPNDYIFKELLESHNLLDTNEGNIISIVPAFYDRLSDFLSKINEDSLNKYEKNKHQKQRERESITLELAANYYLSCKDSGNDEPEEYPYCVDNEALAKRYYDGAIRKVKKDGFDHRTKKWKQRNMDSDCDDYDEYELRGRVHSISSVNGLGDDNFADYEVATYVSLVNGYFDRSSRIDPTESTVIDNLESEYVQSIINMLTDDLERQIAKLRLEGHTHIHIYNQLNLSKSKYYTIFERLKKNLYSIVYEPDDDSSCLSRTTKECTKCKTILSLDLFGNDKRRSDGKKSACRKCDAESKNTK